MPELALYLLGPPRVELDNQSVPLGRHKAVALLAYLALTRQPHSRDALATLLWPELDQSHARGQLRRTLSLLHRTLGSDWLDVDRETAAWADETQSWIDVEALRQHLSACAAHGHPPQETCPACVPLLEEAVDLYCDGFFAGFTLRDAPAFDEWQFFEAEGLRDEMVGVLQRLAGWYGDHEEYDTAIPYARRWLALDPLHEPAHRALMQLYAASGQRAAALRQYGECERLLREELGAAPEPETVELYEAIHGGSYTAFAVGEPPELPLGNLPLSLSSFVGRGRELEDLARLVHDPSIRLVTAVGPGGMGKTRLALETARSAADHFPDGTWWVDLAPLPSDASVTRAVAGALGVQEQPGRPLATVIADSLQGRQVLLVLDNCEHLIDAAAELAAHLLTRCPELTVLATSREPLHLPGEQLYSTPPMSLPEQEVPTPPDLTGFPDGRSASAPVRSLEGGDAMRLFAQRAAAVRPEFILDESNRMVVADVCRRLDGMPLAIELAAARLRALSLCELARRLDERFRLLTGGSRTALPRQQTLRNTVAWSYGLLEERERLLFDRLSVFAGSFSLGGAEAACRGEGIPKEEVLQLLARLLDQSLVGRVEGPGGTTRYRLLETLRAYGQERLAQRGETEEVAARHAGYYVSLAEATELVFHAYGREMIDAQRQLDAEADNLAAAVGWALTRRQPETALRIGGAVHFWTMYRPLYTQYAEWMRQALAQEVEVAPLYRAKAWELISGHALNWGRYEEMGVAAQAELASARAKGDPHWIARGLYWVSLHLRATGQRQEARTCFEECRSLARQYGDAMTAFGSALSLAEYEPLGRRRLLLEEILRQAPYAGRSYGLQFLADAAQLQGDLKGAEAYLRESLAGWTEAGSVQMQSALSGWLGEIHALRGDYASAERTMERGRALARQVGLYPAVIRATRNLGHLAWRQGEFDTAVSRYQESLELARRHSYVEHAALARLGLALVAAERGEHERAEALYAGAQPDLPAWDGEAQVLALSTRGRAALFRGDGARAVALFRQALERACRSESRPDMAELIEHLAWALAADGQADEAARMLALAQREREEMGIVLPPVDRPHHERALEIVQDGLGEAGLAAAWGEGETLSLQAAVKGVLAGTRGTSDGAAS